MGAASEGTTAWRKSTRSVAAGECVEIAEVHDVTATRDVVAMRDSKDPTGPILSFSVSSFRAFIAGAQAGDFDQR
jgi:hypothetical protein